MDFAAMFIKLITKNGLVAAFIGNPGSDTDDNKSRN